MKIKSDQRSQTGCGAPDSGTTFLTMLAIFSRVWDSPDAELSNRDTGISTRTISCQMYRTGPVSPVSTGCFICVIFF